MTETIPNIGPVEIRKRRLFGVIMLITSLVLAALLLGVDAGRTWRLALFIPLWASAVGFFQAREKT